MPNVHAGIPAQYQQPIWGPIDPVLKRCFTVASIIGVLFLIVILLAPVLPPELMTVDNVPDRLARLILEKPAAPSAKLAERVATEAPKAEPKPQEPAKAEPRRRTETPKVAENQGTQGRQIAEREVTQNLAQVTGSLDKVLESVSKSLPASTNPTDEATHARSRRGVRSGRSSTQIASVGGMSTMSTADVTGSAIEGKGISIAAISDIAVSGNGDGDGLPSAGSNGTDGTAAGRNDYRSNESLLAVVRRYAPGIQFCYDNELKKNPGLRGKLVVSITVLPTGAVSDATVVENTLGSDAVTQCVLAQIRGWRFPAIPAGTTSFKTPFVFTPPN